MFVWPLHVCYSCVCAWWKVLKPEVKKSEWSRDRNTGCRGTSCGFWLIVCFKTWLAEMHIELCVGLFAHLNKIYNLLPLCSQVQLRVWGGAQGEGSWETRACWSLVVPGGRDWQRWGCPGGTGEWGYRPCSATCLPQPTWSKQTHTQSTGRNTLNV